MLKEPTLQAAGQAARPSFQLVIPASLELEALLRERNRGNRLHSYAYLCHSIIMGYCDNRRLSQGKYVPLDSRILQGMMTTKEASRVIHDLLEWGVIERDERYVVATATASGKCKGYRFSGKHRGKPVRILTLHNRPMWRKLQEAAAEEQRRQQRLLGASPTLGFLHRQLQWLRLDLPSAIVQVLKPEREDQAWCPPGGCRDKRGRGASSLSGSSIDSAASHAAQLSPPPFLTDSLSPSSISIPILPSLPHPLPPSYVITFSKFMSLSRLDQFHRAGMGEIPWEFKVDPKTGRLFTNLANLGRSFRRHLYLESGERLVIVDVGECQPFMFSALLLEEARKRWGEELPGDVVHFIHLTSTRGFYRFIMEACSVPASERDAFKKTIFGKIFYCSHWTLMQPDNIPGTAFRKHFPNVHEILVRLKGGSKEELPLKLMKLESEIILHEVCEKIAGYGDERFFIATIHDGIVTTEGRAGEVRRLVEEAFRRKLDHVPTVKVEAFNYREDVLLRA